MRGPHPLPLFLSIAVRACQDDRLRMTNVLAGLRRYQAMPPALPRPARPIITKVSNVTLRDFGGTASGKPVLIVPSLINPPSVLDLAPGNSLLAALQGAGLRPLLVDWGEQPESLGLAALVETRLRPLLAGFAAPLPVVGYCLGGTLAAGLAAMGGVSRLALLAAPWHFDGYSDDARAGLRDWWRMTEPIAERLGGVPMDLLQPAFWSLDEAALVAKYARLAEADAKTVAGFTALEDWSNAGPPLALPAARDMAGFYADNAPGRGGWIVGGGAVVAADLGIPVLDVVAMRDRIVPAAAAMSSRGVGQRLEIEAGHVGMIVGRQAEAALWRPLAAWLMNR